MKPLTHEWVDKAEADFATASRELRARKSPNYDSACFHAQQCAEKYLKARLQEAEARFGRTHNLSLLLDAVIAVEPGWEALRSDARALTTFAVAYRYPGESADKALARDALARCRNIREAARRALELEL